MLLPCLKRLQGKSKDIETMKTRKLENSNLEVGLRRGSCTRLEAPMEKLIISLALLTSSFSALGADMSKGADNFYKSDKVTAQKVTFKNQYNMTVAGNLFVPNDLNQGAKHPAIVVGHPMGAVKEQSANLYAQKLAEQGFVTLSLDLSFWGESEGQPRNAVLPDLYAEDFSAAVDFLGTSPLVDRDLGLVFLAFAAAGASSLARPRSTRE